MRYMLLIYLDEQALSADERQQCCDQSVQLARQISASGQYLMAVPLQPTALATSLRVRQGRRLITDGPFAGTYEQLGGVLIIDAADLDAAIAVAARIPMAQRGTIEIRPMIELPGLPQP